MSAHNSCIPCSWRQEGIRPCEEWRTLTGHGQSPELRCAMDKGAALSRTSVPETHGHQSFPQCRDQGGHSEAQRETAKPSSGLRVDVNSMCRKCPPQLSPSTPTFPPGDCSLQHLILWQLLRPESSVQLQTTDPPPFLVYLPVITPPPCSATHNSPASPFNST